MSAPLLSLVVLAGSLAACAPAPVVVPPSARAEAPTAGAALSMSPLPAAQAPSRHTPAAAVSASASDHDGHSMAGHASPEAPAAEAGLAEVLTAYLALHEALASDDADAARAHARHTARAVEAWLTTPPADDPHLWHREAADATALRDAASDLTTADDLAALRRAFGHLSAPLARLVDGDARPDGLALHRCGMTPDVPEGGIWLQREGDVRNPYFGGAMLACGESDTHTGH